MKLLIALFFLAALTGCGGYDETFTGPPTPDTVKLMEEMP